MKIKMKYQKKGLHCMLRFKKKTSSILNLEILTCDPLICSMDHSKFSVSNQVEESIVALQDKGTFYL